MKVKEKPPANVVLDFGKEHIFLQKLQTIHMFIKAPQTLKKTPQHYVCSSLYCSLQWGSSGW